MNAKIHDQAEDAQRDKQKLAGLLDQTIDTMPTDTDPAEYAAVAWALITETIGSGVRRGLLPVRGHAETLTRCRQTLYGVTRTGGLAAFQASAKATLRNAVCGG